MSAWAPSAATIPLTVTRMLAVASATRRGRRPTTRRPSSSGTGRRRRRDRQPVRRGDRPRRRARGRCSCGMRGRRGRGSLRPPPRRRPPSPGRWWTASASARRRCRAGRRLLRSATERSTIRSRASNTMSPAGGGFVLLEIPRTLGQALLERYPDRLEPSHDGEVQPRPATGARAADDGAAVARSSADGAGSERGSTLRAWPAREWVAQPAAGQVWRVDAHELVGLLLEDRRHRNAIATACVPGQAAPERHDVQSGERVSDCRWFRAAGLLNRELKCNAGRCCRRAPGLWRVAVLPAKPLSVIGG